MKNTALWALAFALAVGCGSESKTGDTVPTGGVPGPEGSDGFYTVSDLAAQEGALLQDIAVSEDTIYGCTGGHGLMVAKRVGWTGLELVGYVTFTDGKGCRAVTVAPDGALFATGQADAGGSFVASLEPGTGNVQSSVVLPGLTIESMVASETHVFTALGEGGITILGRSGGGLAEVSTLANGFEQALGIALWDNKRIVVANGLAGLAVVDVSDPAAPKISDSIEAYGTARRVQMVGDHAYVAGATGGVAVYDMTSNKPYPPLSSWSTHASSVDLAVTAGGLVYVANIEDVCVLDGSDPGQVTFLGSEFVKPHFGKNGRTVSVDVVDEVGYAAEWSGMWGVAYAPGLAAPDVHLSKIALDFGLVSLKKGKGIVVQNLGDEPLELSEWTVNHPDFTIDLDQKTLLPGKTAFLEITFVPADGEPVEAMATVQTNDPDETTLNIPLTANKIDGVQVGAPFDPNSEMIYDQYKTGNQVTVKQEYAGKVVVLVYFASW